MVPDCHPTENQDLQGSVLQLPITHFSKVLLVYNFDEWFSYIFLPHGIEKNDHPSGGNITHTNTVGPLEVKLQEQEIG